MFSLLAQTALPPPDTIRDTALEVVSRPDYNVDDPSLQETMPIWLKLFRWLIKPFQWLYESMEGWPDSVRWLIVILCVVVLIALTSHIVYTFVLVIRGPDLRRERQYLSAAQAEVDPDSLELEAERAGRGGDYIGAIRLLFRAALRRIEVGEKRKLRPGATNRELLRRYRSTPLHESLERFVETIDNKWYGGVACLESDYALCRSEHDRIRQYVERSKPVVGA